MKTVDLNARYSINHEWARKEGDYFTIGITDFGQTCFKEITNVDFPKIGTYFKKGGTVCILESVKAANEVETPMSGSVVEINKYLITNPQLVNESCYKKGWLVKIQASKLEEYQQLLSAEQYQSEISVFFNKSR